MMKPIENLLLMEYSFNVKLCYFYNLNPENIGQLFLLNNPIGAVALTQTTSPDFSCTTVDWLHVFLLSAFEKL